MARPERTKLSTMAKLRVVLWSGLVVVGLVTWIASLRDIDGTRTWYAMLINFLFFTPLMAGLVTWSAVVRVSQGRWMGALERFASAGIFFALPSTIVLIVLWLGRTHWAPWEVEPPPQQVWLQPTFIFARDLIALVAFWVMAVWYLVRRHEGRGGIPGAWLIVAYGIAFSLLGFDLVMSLDPHWYSALFGGYFFMSGLYAAVAGWAVLAAWQPDAAPVQRHDLGKLVFTFCMLTTYLMFSQLLPIWYENLPAEVRFVVPRMNFSNGKAVSWVLIALIYIGPLAFFLTVWSKKNRWSLGITSLVILAGLWLERWWLVEPTLAARLQLGAIELATTLAFIGIVGLGQEWLSRRGEWFLPREVAP